MLAHTDWKYRGDCYVNADNLHNPYIPGRAIGNVPGCLSSSGACWQVALRAQKQIFYFGEPLTHGVRGSINF